MTEPSAMSKSVTRRLRVQLQPWEQQPGENDLWYGRFLRYLALGPGRSVSLVAKGRRNAYPVPAHWPIQARQLEWKTRAEGFDEAYKVEEVELNKWFVATLVSTRDRLPTDEANKTMGIMYQAPPPEEDYEDEPKSSAL